MKKLLSHLLIVIAVTAFSCLTLTGCGEKEAEPSKETVQQSDRLTKIKQDSGGDWEKVSEADKQWLIKDVCYGNEASAKMMVGGPPKPKVGPNGGPPTGVKPGP